MCKKLLTFIILGVVVAITTSIGFSEDKTETKAFRELIATTSDTHLILFGVVNNGYTEEMISGLQSGIPIQFSFYVELYQKLSREEGELVAHQEFRHRMSYDTLKDSYTIELGEANSKRLSTANLEEAKRLMSEINGLQVVHLDKLIPDKQYHLRIRAELFEKTLPMGLHRVLPFLSWWNLETKWQTIEFNY